MSEITKPIKKTRQRYGWFLGFVALLLIAFSLLIAYGYHISEMSSVLSYPLLSAVREIRSGANAVHGHLRRIALNEIPVNSTPAWHDLEQAIWHLDIMLGKPERAGQAATEWQTDHRLQGELNSLKSNFMAYRSAVNDFFGLRDASAVDTLPPAVGQRFEQLLGDLDTIETIMNQRLKHEHREFRWTIVGMTAFSLLMIVIAGVSSWRFERQQIRTQVILAEANDELEAKVAKRTQWLSRANDQLLHEIEAHKESELQLLQYQKQLRRMGSELMQTQERERRRIATEIHDRIGQGLAVTKIQLGALQVLLNDPSQVATVEDIRALITQTIQDTRTLTFELSPPVLYELGLLAALEWLAETLQKQSGLIVHISGNSHQAQLSIERRVFLFQAVRELLFNVIKHANATTVDIQLMNAADSVRVHVRDDGCGFDPHKMNQQDERQNNGFGLFSLREQLRHYGGQLIFESQSGRGTLTTIVMPLETAA